VAQLVEHLTCKILVTINFARATHKPRKYFPDSNPFQSQCLNSSVYMYSVLYEETHPWGQGYAFLMLIQAAIHIDSIVYIPRAERGQGFV
jgi:hypothetical protein